MTNAQVIREQLSVTDPSSPSPANPAQITRYDDYIIQPTFPNTSVAISVDAFDTTQYDPILQVYQLSPEGTAPLPNQAPIATNDDRALGNQNATIATGAVEFGTFLGAPSTLTADGVSRYLIRVTSYEPLPNNSIFPPTGQLPQDYQLAASVNLGNLNPPTVADGGILGPNDFDDGGGTIDPLTGVARFWDNQAGGHIFTADNFEKNQFANNSQRYINEGFEFLSGGDTTLQRYRNQRGGYFYASNPGEIAFVETLQEWTLDNPATPIQVYATQVPGTSPVYRAFNFNTGGHFYTIDPAQAAAADALPNFVDQGISFYAQPIA
ncbi:nuclease [Lyngbya sp. CCY1209]|uniref:nuclease n=1 Tax=Lyngbya sp. CCY1209 TaxID=2886103 RepID=UPI002D206383|nr:nuclease [Lyngbya sp. CCY1209]MEB3883383.1 nuclease [Lyngbya sp. CCY1209]